MIVNRTREQGGQGLVEFSIVLPIVLLLMVGIFDFGRLAFLYAQASNAAREGARYGAVSGLDLNDPQYLDCVGIQAAVRRTGVLPQALQITIVYDSGHPSQPVAADCQAGGYGEPTAARIALGDRVVVKVDSTFTFAMPGLRSMGPLSLSFTSARTILSGGTALSTP